MANLEAESQVSGEVGSLGRHKKTSPSTKDCVTKGTQKRNNVAFWGESHVISLLINGILVILFLELVTYNFASFYYCMFAHELMEYYPQIVHFLGSVSFGTTVILFGMMPTILLRQIARAYTWILVLESDIIYLIAGQNINPLIYLFHQYFLNTYYVPGTVLGSKGIKMTKAQNLPLGRAPS